MYTVKMMISSEAKSGLHNLSSVSLPFILFLPLHNSSLETWQL